MERPPLDENSILPTGATPLAPQTEFRCNRQGCPQQHLQASEYITFNVKGTSYQRTLCKQHAAEKKQESMLWASRTAQASSAMPPPRLTKGDIQDIREQVNEGQRIGNRAMALPPMPNALQGPPVYYPPQEVIQTNRLLFPPNAGYSNAHHHHRDDQSRFQAMVYVNPTLRLAAPANGMGGPFEPQTLNSRQAPAPMYARPGSYTPSPTTSPEKSAVATKDPIIDKQPELSLHICLYAVDADDDARIHICSEGLAGISLHITPKGLESAIHTFLQQVVRSQVIPPLEEKCRAKMRLALKKFFIRDSNDVKLNGPGMPPRVHMFEKEAFFTKKLIFTVTLDELDSAEYLKFARGGLDISLVPGHPNMGSDAPDKLNGKPAGSKKRPALPFPLNSAELPPGKRARAAIDQAPAGLKGGAQKQASKPTQKGLSQNDTLSTWMKEPPPPTKEPEPAATINRVDSITSDVAQEPRDGHSTPLNPEVKLAEERLVRERALKVFQGSDTLDADPVMKERQATLGRRGVRENALLQSLNQITQLVVLQDIDTSIDNKMGSGATKLAIRAQVWVSAWADDRVPEGLLPPLGEAQDVVLKKTKPELAIVLKGQDKKGDPSGNLGETDVVSDFEILKMELLMLDTARDMVDWVKKAEEKHYQQLEGIAAIPSNELPVVEYKGVTLSEAAETYPKASRYLEYLQHMTFVQSGYKAFISDLQGCVVGNRITLTDPQIMTCQGQREGALPPLFASGNLKSAAHAFWFEHVCNEFDYTWVDVEQVNRATYEAALLRYHNSFSGEDTIDKVNGKIGPGGMSGEASKRNGRSEQEEIAGLHSKLDKAGAVVGAKKKKGGRERVGAPGVMTRSRVGSTVADVQPPV
ncbi:hypothetical protein BKA70DRAFT_1449406 [Coprinopsis sp. MPI-PUGE-AT-0042]|nr:hypothetical protein BKA70DRAFT_1449406 [Coprinopsis sp. MPI-PUGE-AT-0042]